MSDSLLTPPPTTLAPVSFDDLCERASRAIPTNFPRDPAEFLIALDLDGTVLGPRGASAHTRSVIRDLQDAGANVVVATGRGVAATEPAIKELQITDGWLVCSNGAVLVRVDGGELDMLVNERFDPTPVIDAVSHAYPHALFAVEDGRGGYRINSPFPPRELIEDWEVDTLDGLRSRPVTKLVVRIPDMERDDFERRMFDLNLSTVEVAVGWTSWMDVGPLSITKATGLEGLRERLGVPGAGTVAIGDGTNDIPMLDWASFPVAMAGASEVVTAHAKHVTGPVDYDGAAAVMRALLARVN